MADLKITNPRVVGKLKLPAESAGKALQISATGEVEASTVTTTALAHVAGMTSTAVSIDGAQTLANKTLTSPVINSPTGIVKGDVQLGNVDNTSDATKNAAAATLTNKTISASSNTISNLSTVNLASGILDIDLTSVAGTDTTIPSAKAVKDYVDAQDALYLPLAGGSMTGDLTMVGGSTVTGIPTPSASTDAVPKSYVDALSSGFIWLDPVNDSCLADDSLSTPPVSPRDSVVYIVAASATGAWAGKEGHALWWKATTSQWIDLFPTRAVQAGDRFILNFHAGFGTPLFGGSFVGKANQIATVTGGSAGAYTYSFTTPANTNAVSVTNANSDHYGVSRVYDSATSKWVQFQGPASTSLGDALEYRSATLYVKYDNTTIGINVDNQLEVKNAGISNAHISVGAAIEYSKLALTGSIVNADIATSAAIAQSKIANLVSNLAAKEPTITATTTADYFRGDKSFQPLNKAAVGLSNVDNTSDATKNAAAVTLTNKTISASSNTISDLTVSNLATGVLDTNLTVVSGTDDTIPSAKAVKSYVDSLIGTSGVNGDIYHTSINANNNQTIPLNVAGLEFPAAIVRSFKAQVSVSIDATNDLNETFDLMGVQTAAGFVMSVSSVGDDSGVVFTITSAGQVQYISQNYAGFTALTINFRALVTTAGI